MFKTHSEKRKGKCVPCKTSKPLLCPSRALTLVHSDVTNHGKDVSNPKSIPANFHFRKPGHSFNLHSKFALIEILSNIQTSDKDILKF